MHTSRIMATCPMPGTAATKPKGGMAPELMDVYTYNCGLQSTMIMLPLTPSKAWPSDFQIGMAEIQTGHQQDQGLKYKLRGIIKKFFVLFLAHLCLWAVIYTSYKWQCIWILLIPL